MCELVRYNIHMKFLFKLLEFNSYKDQVAEWVKNPEKSAKAYITGVIYGYFSKYVFGLLFVLIGLGVLAFSGVLAPDPTALVRVLFYLLLAVVVVALVWIAVVAYVMRRMYRHYRERFRSEFGGGVREAEYSEGSQPYIDNPRDEY